MRSAHPGRTRITYKTSWLGRGWDVPTQQVGRTARKERFTLFQGSSEARRSQVGDLVSYRLLPFRVELTSFESIDGCHNPAPRSDVAVASVPPLCRENGVLRISWTIPVSLAFPAARDLLVCSTMTGRLVRWRVWSIAWVDRVDLVDR